MSLQDTAISVKNLSKVYKLYNKHIDRMKEAIHPFKKKYHRNFYAVKNIGLKVKRGEILGIVGRNGAGKSTLLGIITGILTPTTGNCIVNGRISALLELGSGFNPELTGIENIYLNGTIKGYTKKEMDEKLDEILSFAEIGDFINQPIKTYSSGMKARLGFAVAVNIDPEVLILDEVLSVGDELFRRKCHAKMEELFKSGCTVLYVSHSLNTVNDICSRAILLDKGELILEGPPKFVTMYYQKFFNAKKEEQNKVRNEIIQLNKQVEKKQKFAVNLEKNEMKSAVIEKEKTQIDEKKQEPKEEAFYIPNFVPKSTVVTKNYDVDIYDTHIKTLKGKKVNVLIMNEEYIYSFKVKFNIDAFEVGFGTPFKTEKGLIITNHNLHGRGFIKTVEKGSELLIDCYFKCILFPGTYYTNATVGSVIDGERVVLNRIVDALVFKVQPTGKNEKHTGLVYCGQFFDIKKL